MSDHLGILSDLSHEQYLSASGCSHSMLKIIAEQSEMHLKAYLDAPKEKPTEAQVIGTLTHRALLLPDTLAGAFYVIPEGMDFRTKDGKAWKAEHSDRSHVSHDHWKATEGMIASIHRHPIAKRLLKNATYEQSIFVEDSHGTLRKLRPDILPNGGDVLPDLKTCLSAHPDDFQKAIGNNRYWTQGAYYLTGANLAGMLYTKFALIAVEKEPPYAVAVYVIDDFAIEYGHRINEVLIQRYRNAVESGIWPGYQEKLTYIGLPKWLQREAEQAA